MLVDEKRCALSNALFVLCNLSNLACYFLDGSKEGSWTNLMHFYDSSSQLCLSNVWQDCFHVMLSQLLCSLFVHFLTKSISTKMRQVVLLAGRACFLPWDLESKHSFFSTSLSFVCLLFLDQKHNQGYVFLLFEHWSEMFQNKIWILIHWKLYLIE